MVNDYHDLWLTTDGDRWSNLVSTMFTSPPLFWGFVCFRATNRRFFGGRAIIFQWFIWWWWCRMINDIIFSWCFVVRGDWLACVCFYSFVYAIVFQNWGLPKGVLGGELNWSACLWFTTLHIVAFQKRELPQEGLIRELKGMMIGLFGFGYATSVFPYTMYYKLKFYICLAVYSIEN
jgi:hypothetical protein